MGANDIFRKTHNIEAEQSIIGGLLTDGEAWDKVCDIIDARDFYREEHRHVLAHIAKLADKKVPIDIVTVYDSLRQAGKANGSGGDLYTYMVEIANSTPSSANIRTYANMVRDKAQLRRLTSAANKIIEDVMSPGIRNAREIIDAAETNILAVSEKESGADGMRSAAPIMAEVIDHIEKFYNRENPDDLLGLPTGFKGVDDITCGLQSGDLIVIAGRPSMGKTAIAVNIAEHVVLREKKPAVIFSMEMSGAQLGLRILSSTSGIPLQKLRRAELSDNDFDALSVALGQIHDAPLFIDDSGGLTVAELRARVRRQHRQCGGLGLIVIDYLQLMTIGREAENRAAEISEISRSIKSLAKEINVPIIALSQLSRKVEERTEKRPIMSDLRDSGALEQDADIIIMMYRDEYYNPNTEHKGVAEAILTKHRNGPTGTVSLEFHGHCARFTS